MKGNNKRILLTKKNAIMLLGLIFFIAASFSFRNIFSSLEVKTLKLELEALKSEVATLKATTKGSLPSSGSWDPQINPLSIPQGQAPNLPSIRLEEDTVKRKNYGGTGDKQHLGGFAKFDNGGISPAVFKRMIDTYGVKSFLDIGCGRGISTSWFHFHGVEVKCAEGSHDAVTKTLLPDPENQLVEHDFSRGPWWPEKTYDAAWSVEFLEHVNSQFMYNYITAFRKAALIFVTASSGMGWHHVEVHSNEWWINKYESWGFKYNPVMTEQVRNWARASKKDYVGPNGYLDGFYIRVTMKVFINPVVAALPQHAHLFPELGCLGEKGVKRKCSEEYQETPLDPSFEPLIINDEMDKAWDNWIKDNINKDYQQ